MTNGHTHQTDVVIVGAGPVGLFAVFECGMVRLKCHVVDVLDDVGGQCTALYPEKPIYDIPGFPRLEAAELIVRLRAQAAPFHPVYHLGQQVQSLEATTGGFWRLTTSRGTVLQARAVIVAAGVGAFGPNRPPLDGIETFEGKSVFYYVTQREAFRGKRVVIAGGGDSAVDWALSLGEIAGRVSVVHRRAKFRAAPESEAKLRALAKAGKVDLVVPYQLHSLDGADGRLTAVNVATLDGMEKKIEADILLPFFGLSMSLGPIADWGVALERNQIVVDPATAATDKPGLFAIGDVVTYPGKLKLILTGFAEAAIAARSAYALVHPEQPLHFEYSTTSGVPTA
ncbi:NAD(P)/FAD-dependent oxidoreductase [Enhydrobacter sp.]|jgi:thioredoxin reductase (NADPH)|uniref:NAD(P)/FAD-dependent oxidoreductase n=1 Tax=Enhydrobacter sp. TaxID=1894999 RepID=UPI002637BAB8|nr:NAD(P)/FAD-dependent oxidoreductase [Enhydrobacter sp.]WIM14270.1 MAG: Thioredoxin reductase [Enhydrobacter sp.]